MATAYNEGAQAAYRPTSLDFINLPNPIEPHAGTQRHPLNGTPRLEKARVEANTNPLLRLILEEPSERPVKRQRATDNLLDLPKLPVRTGPKRPRIPPTLSGLHQPPPDAGLLPSISVEQPTKPSSGIYSTSQTTALLESQKPASASQSLAQKNTKPATAPDQSHNAIKKPSKRNKWSDEETGYLLKGVAQFGIGNWTAILRCPDYTFSRRTALDLKDRFRVCCPQQYKKPSNRPQGHLTNQRSTRSSPKSKPSDIASVKIQARGINAPFLKTDRRSRHTYSAIEDEALLKGFQKYGAQWALIKQDAEAELAERRPTDLRDRLRTRFPEEYARAGLASKKSKNQQRISRTVSDTGTGSDEETIVDPTNTSQPNSTQVSALYDSGSKDEFVISKANDLRHVQQPALFSLDDVFLGSALGTDQEDVESEPIILDRGILDWAGRDSNKYASAETLRTNSIDPLMTLNLPKPHVSFQAPAPAVQQPLPTNNNTSLPSLSAMFPDALSADQLELPSLMTWLGPMEADGRNGGSTFPSLEELFG